MSDQPSAEHAGGLSGGLPPPAQSAAPAVRRIIKNSTLNLAAQVLQACFNLVAFIALTRSLSKEALGLYYTLFAVVMIVQLVLDAGVGTVLTRRIARAPEHWRDVVAEAAGIFALGAAAAVALFSAAGACWAAWRPDPAALPAFAAAGVTCAGLHGQRFAMGVLRAFEAFAWENTGKVLQAGSFATMVIGLVLLDHVGIATAMTALAASYVIGDLFLLAWLYRRGCRVLRLRSLRGWLAEAAPLGFSDAVRGPSWQLDTVLLGLFRPPEVVGSYNVAYRPLSMLNWLPMAALTATFPFLIRTAAEPGPAFNRAFAASMRLLWVTGLPLAVGIGVCAERVVVLLAGPTFADAGAPMRLLVVKTAVMFLSMHFRFVFTAVGRQDVFARLVLVAFGAEAALELALIPVWGSLGAAAGSVLGEVLFTAGGLVVCARLGISGIRWGGLLRACVAGAVMGLVLWPMRTAPLPLLVLGAAAATLLYFGLCVLLRALPWAEVRPLFFRSQAR